MIQIAVLGYGTVGSGVVEVINTNQTSINKKAGEEINIKYVLDLRDFPGDPIQEKIVHDFEVIVNDPEIKIVVEVMGGVEPAYTFTKRALMAGKSVCTSQQGAGGPDTERSFWRLPESGTSTICLRPAAAAEFRLSVR